MDEDKKMDLIKTWFKARFDKKPENDKAYFQEWIGRFAGLKEGEYPWQMDLASRKTWKQVNSL